MTRPLFSAFALFLSSFHAFAQPNRSPAPCSATEQAVREVTHQLWAAYNNRDLATLEKLIDDDAIATDDGGTRKGKQEILAAARRPEGDIHKQTDEQPEDFRVMFTSGVAILNYTKHWTDYEEKMGINWGATSRITVVLACKNAKWRRMAFQETDIPNKDRKPSASAIDHLDDYVGHYRFGENGDKGELSVVRKGDALSESWAGEEATELLPGKYDTFFSREDRWLERFVRDKSGKVTGILYTLPDGEFEAKRVQ
jgi:ketosteroid isomerase-like protein